MTCHVLGVFLSVTNPTAIPVHAVGLPRRVSTTTFPHRDSAVPWSLSNVHT
jgi:hypothetical protein